VAAEKGCDYTVVNRPAGRALRGIDRPCVRSLHNYFGEGDKKMKQLLTVLIAAMFAAVSLGAIAQDKGKSETQKEMKKKEGKKVAKEKKAAAKKPVKVDKK
jgi:hypothetical protein